MVQMEFCYKHLWYLVGQDSFSTGTRKSYLVKDDDWIIIIFRFFCSWRRPYLGKIEKKLKLTSPHVREPDYSHYYYSMYLMPDKSWRGMRPCRVTALCISRLHSDPLQAVSFALEGNFGRFFLLALFWSTSTFMKMRLLAGIWKGVTLKQLEKWTRKWCASLSG